MQHNQTYRWAIACMALLIFPLHVWATPESAVNVTTAFSSLKVDKSQQVLATVDVTNQSPEVLDVRRITIENKGTISMKSAFNSFVLVHNGDEVSTRYQITEDWNRSENKPNQSFVELWVSGMIVDPGDTMSFDLRGVVQNLEKGTTFLPTVQSVSVKATSGTFVRDIDIEVSPGTKATAFESGGDYSFSQQSQNTRNGKPDLVIEEIQFLEKRGYTANVIVVPVCNQGFAPTNGERIEATIYAPDQTRDFSIRQTLAVGKCFEYELSAKRDLGISADGGHIIRVELDQQNIIAEERENNNSRREIVTISNNIQFDTNNRTLEVVQDDTRQVIRRDVRPRRPRVTRAPRTMDTSVRGTTKRGTSDALSMYRALLAARQEERKRVSSSIHPSYGLDKNRSQASEVKKEFLSQVDNGIIREELPEKQTVEDAWEAQAWERPPFRTWRKPAVVRQVAPPNQLIQKEAENKPTFVEPSAVHKKRISHRALRAGFRGKANFTGQRSNNLPDLDLVKDLNASCTDSDGINFFEKGQVQYKSQRMGNLRTVYDEVRGPYVLEYYCEGDYMRRQLFECEGGNTVEGACAE